MSEIFTERLSGTIVWRLSESGPYVFPLPGFPGFSLITPVGRRFLQGIELPTSATFRRITTSDYLIETTELTIARELSARVTAQTPPGSPSFADATHQLLRSLHLGSRQFMMPTGTTGSTLHGEAELTFAPRPIRCSDIRGGMVCDYLLSTAISTPPPLGLAIAGSSGASVEVMLDALKAHVEGDRVKAILYSSMAAEAGAVTALDARYAEALKATDATLRVVSIRGAGGASVTKDPVWETLSQLDGFAKLLHEKPLYLMGRSLMLEEPHTYRDAIRLYKTRNSIAHGELPSDLDNQFPVTFKGTIGALDAAAAVLRWFGDSGPHTVHRFFVGVDNPSLRVGIDVADGGLSPRWS